MKRRRLLNLHTEKNRHGTIVYYVRRPGALRVRIRGAYGSEEFLDQYRAALAGQPMPAARPVSSASLESVIRRYQTSADWNHLSAATKKARANIFRGVIAKAGDAPYASIGKRDIRASIEVGAPFAAINWLKAMRGMFKWSVKSGHLASDPTDGIKPVTPASDGFRPWTEEDVVRFEKRWSIGTRERLTLAILLCTGLRRGDAVRLGPSHIINGSFEIQTEKTGQLVIMPILPELAEAIAAGPVGSETFIARLDGMPMVKEGFGTWFREACKAAGVPGSSHGLRKLGATRAANAGASERELNALFGWGDGSRESATYTKSADRRRLARQAIDKMTKP